MDRLIEAEKALINEIPLPIKVEGEDEGEQLTHILAAIWIMGKMDDANMDFHGALREYTKMVRESLN